MSDEVIVTDERKAQFRRALEGITDVLVEARMDGPDAIAVLTWIVVDLSRAMVLDERWVHEIVKAAFRRENYSLAREAERERAEHAQRRREE